MHTLIIKNIDRAIMKALQVRAAAQDTSVEIEVVRALSEALLKPNKKTLAETLASIPHVGLDSDFERINTSFKGHK